MTIGNGNDFDSMSMLDLFRLEVENQCSQLAADLLALEQEPTAAALLESLMRAAHSVKGAARVVEIHAAVKLAHAMEDVFVAAQSSRLVLNPDHIDLLLAGVDLLSSISPLSDAELNSFPAAKAEAIESLVNRLTKLCQNKKGVKSPPEKPVPEAGSPLQESPGASPRHGGEIEPAPAGPVEDSDDQRAVRVSARNMDRMIGLAGESIIESRWLPTFSKELLQLKYRQEDLYTYADKIRDNLQTAKAAAENNRFLDDLLHKLEICRSMLIQDIEVLEEHARRATSISHRLYKEILTSKMRPFAEGIKGFARMVRDVARELGKDVAFEVIGADTMVDRDILDKIEAPLNHMIRNALDHGIESPAHRVASGKPAKGTIQLLARHSAGMLSITVRDDGCGVDLEKIRRAIVGKNLCPPEIAANLSNQELFEFTFLPNFSTRKSVSNISGRGVGMNVVHSVINELRGKIRSSTQLNEGSSFELQLPLTLSILRALLAEINCEVYGFPLVSIDHVIRLAQDDIQEIEGRQYFTFNDKRIGIVSAQQVFNAESAFPANQEHIHVIIFSDRLKYYGLTVNKFLGVKDLVVQHLDSRLGKVKDINSAAVLEDGTPVLIIDVEDVLNSLDQLISGNRIMPIGVAEDRKKRIKRILVADDSITVREVERKMLAARGYEVDVAVDGMDAWNSVRAKHYDLIVSDIDMPRLNGFELVSLIKSDPDLRNLPVIIVSYKDREEDRNKGLEVGADYYLSKGSFHDQALVNAVLDLIGQAEE